MDSAVPINKILLPFSWLYGVIVNLRNTLFDHSILQSESFSIPIISVGNLTVSGTGKTPHTEYLIRLLSKKYRVAVLSRGYKRKTNGFRLAIKTDSAYTLGDEPYQMFRKFPNVLIAVDWNRRRGIRQLLALPKLQRPEVILLDDAFQHRQIKPSLSILLTNSNRPFWQDTLLPAGRLREPAANSARADIIIYTKTTSIRPQAFPITKFQTVFYTSYAYKGLLPIFPDVHSIKKESLERLKKESYSLLVVTGLAWPSDMLHYVRQYTTDLHTLLFPDHHTFAHYNLVKIERIFRRIPNRQKIIITSEKDAVRMLGQSSTISEDIRKFMYYLPIEVIFLEGQNNSFIQRIENHVTNFARNCILA